MTSRERVFEALNHRQTDPIPYTVSFTPGAYEHMQHYTGDKAFDKDWVSHMHSVMYDGWPTPIPDRQGFMKDEFGVVLNRTMDEREWGVVESYQVDFENNQYVFPPLDEARWRGDIERMLASKGDRFAFASLGCSLYERSWTLAGMENVLAAMVMYPSEYHELLDRICERNMRVIEIALEYDIDGFYFGDDWGSQRGMIMGPDHWRTFIKPRDKRMYGLVKKHGKIVLHHSCGNIEAIMRDFIEIGCDCYETVQPDVYDLAKLKTEYGADITFWGCISEQQLLPYGTPQQVRDVTINTLRLMGKNGGFIAAPTHAITRDVPPENVLAMADVFVNQDKYL